MDRCSNCMSIGVIQGICPYCGYDNSRQNGAHQLPVGTILNGQYTVGRVLGQGGFGITYKGWDNFLDIPVAIKEYFPTSYVSRTCSQSYEVRSYGGDVEARFEHNKRRFQKEVKALAKFSDIKEIVQVKNFFFANNTAYIVMQYVDGIELQDYVRRRGGRLSMDETKKILEPMIKAIAMVHKEGLIHRDISPDNIMLLPDGSVKLLDFGAVRDVGIAASDSGMSRSTSTEAIVKHGFAPIEQYVNNGNTGTWTDVYALCATIYYCVTGRVPTDAASRMMGEVLPWFRELGLDVPIEDEAAIKHGMELQIEKRTQTLGELHTELYYPAEEARKLREEQERERLRLEREQAELRRRAELDAQKEPPRLRDAQELKRVQKKTIATFLLAVTAILLMVYSINKWTDCFKPKSNNSEVLLPASTASISTVSPENDPADNFYLSLDFSNIYTPEEWNYKASEKFAEMVKEKTDGHILINYYGSNSLACYSDSVAQAVADANWIGLEDPTLFASYVGDAAMVTAPMLYNSTAEYNYVMDSDYIVELTSQLAQNNIHILDTHFTRGFRSVYTTFPVTNPEDLNGHILRTGADMRLSMTLEYMGATPQLLSFSECYIALEQGIIEGFDGSISTLAKGDLYQLTSNAALTNHLIATSWLFMSENTWQSIPEKYQTILSDCAYECGFWAQSCYDEEEQTLKDRLATSSGVVFNTVDVDAFREACLPVIDWIVDEYGADYVTYNNFRSSVAEYRQINN